MYLLYYVRNIDRLLFFTGLSEEAELHQYVLYDTREGKRGPRRINLDDDMKNKYAPPQNLTVHLSKISMPELQPKIHTNEKHNLKEDRRKEDKKGWWWKPIRSLTIFVLIFAFTFLPYTNLLHTDTTTTTTHLGKTASATPANSRRPSPSGSSNNKLQRSTPPPTTRVSTKLPPSPNSAVFPVPNQPGQTATSLTKPVNTTARVQGFFDMLAHASGRWIPSPLQVFECFCSMAY